MEPLLLLRDSVSSLVARKSFNLPDRPVQHWKAFSSKHEDYPLDHLDSVAHTFAHPTREERYLIYFTYSHHVFTRSIKTGEVVPAEQIYNYPPDRRVFDERRYRLSHFLPEIIRTLPDQFCYHGGYSRYCSCKLTDDEGNSVEYQVVYRTWKERGKLRFHIESAYPLDQSSGRKKKVSFWVICHNLLNGKQLPKPPNR